MGERPVTGNQGNIVTVPNCRKLLMDWSMVVETLENGCHGLYSTRAPQVTLSARVEYNPWHPAGEPGAGRLVIGVRRDDPGEPRPGVDESHGLDS